MIPKLSSVVIGAVLMYAALNLHVVFYDDGVTAVTKEEMTLSDTFIDARDISVSALINYPAPVRDFLIANATENVKGKLGLTKD